MISRIIDLSKNHSFFLFGPRQTGKSTLIRETFPAQETLYYNLLDTDQHTRFLARPALLRDEVTTTTKKYVVVDEIQRVPELLNEIHSLLESPHRRIFVLCGSSARKLKRAQANLLAGRAWTYRLHPLTHRECGNAFSLEKAMRIGTLPAIYLEESESAAREGLTSYVETYLKEEITAEAVTRNLGGFLRFLSFAANENGNIINFSNIAREIGITYKTVQGYFQVLEDTLMGSMLPPYARTSRKRLVKHPKFYFFDIGVQRAMARKVTAPLERRTPEFGRGFEHFLIAEVLRLIDYGRREDTVSFYRTEADAEVDLIVETPAGKTYAIEIKATDTPDSSQLRGLYSFREVCPDAELLCASLAPLRRVSGGVTILPWRELFEHLGV